MRGLLKPKYFRPYEFIHNASNFNRLPIDKQYRKNSANMVKEAVLKQSLQNTLKKTDVWRNDAVTFKLNGAGLNNQHRLKKLNLMQASTSSQISNGSPAQSKRESGHVPTMTVRD